MAKKKPEPNKDELIAQLGGALSSATRSLDSIYSGAGAADVWHKSPRRKAIAKAFKQAGVQDPADYS